MSEAKEQEQQKSPPPSVHTSTRCGSNVHENADLLDNHNKEQE